MKTTIRAMLININEKYQRTLDDMMLVFSTAERFAFKRLLEGQKRVNWKSVLQPYIS